MTAVGHNSWGFLGRAIALAVVVTAVAAADDIEWERPDGSFPNHGGCVYLGPRAIGDVGWGFADDLTAMQKRSKETRQLLALIPQRREARRAFEGLTSGARAADTSGPCSGIDDCVAQSAEAAGLTFAELTSDAEFLRRVRLDLTGRIPTTNEVTAFLADGSEDKREALVDTLLEEEEWADRWAMFFGDHFRNTQRTVQVNRYLNGRDSLHLYLLGSMRENKPYDQMAREMIAAEGTSDGRPYPEAFESAEHYQSVLQDYEGNPVVGSPVSYIVGGRTSGGPIQDTYDTLAFFMARDFLGVSTLECVLCHDGEGRLEGLSAWGTRATRLQGWKLAAFFSDIPRLITWRRLVTRDGKRIPGRHYTITDLDFGETEQSRFGDTAGEYLAQTEGGNRPDRLHLTEYVEPSYPFEGTAVVDSGSRLREQLGAYLTADPQFARAAVNYIWKQFFSRGLVEPADQFDLDRIDPGAPPPTGWNVQPSHPHLLNWLADGFRANGFDLKWLMREIATSQTYQLSSRYDGVFSPEYEKFFVRHQAKRLTGEQIHDSLLVASGTSVAYRISRNVGRVEYAMQFPDVNGMPTGDRALILDVRALLRAFLPGDRETTRRSGDGSPLQALNLMNNPFVVNRIRPNASSGTIADSLAMEDQPLVANLYLSALSRYPTETELAQAVAYLNDRTDGIERRGRAVDLMWALFNKTEFYTNY